MNTHAELLQTITLPGKVAVLTGAASGLAREAARIFALADARLILADIDEKGLAETARIVEALGGQATCRRTDVAVKDEVEALADAALAETGRVDVWVNAAGRSSIHTVLQTRQEDAEKTIAVNMLGTMWGCMAAARIMGPQGSGSIINVSSAGGAIPLPNMSVYGMTKAAVNSLTKTCAAEFGPMGLRVNAVAPGYCETEMATVLFRDAEGRIDPARRDHVIQQMAATSPLGRIAVPADIAHALLYLASDASSFVTGQVFAINGGASM